MEHLEKRRCVIVAAGETESVDILKKNIFYDDFVIAADAGYTKLKAASIEPNLIVGDFDSSDIPENDIETIILSPIKDCTDTEFALAQAYERGFREMLIIGALGGRVDHSYANICLVAQYRQKGARVTIIDDKHKIYCLKNEEISVADTRQYVSVFAFAGECKVFFEGFYYGTDVITLTPFDVLGTSNELVEEVGRINVISGTAVIIEALK